MAKGFVLWTKPEIMVAVYFISRGLTEAAVSDILRARGYQRSTSAVRCKIKYILRHYSGLQDAQHEWCIHAVDNWLDNQGLPHSVVSQVIGPTDKDIAAIEKHEISIAVLQRLDCIKRYRCQGILGSE